MKRFGCSIVTAENSLFLGSEEGSKTTQTHHGSMAPAAQANQANLGSTDQANQAPPLGNESVRVGGFSPMRHATEEDKSVWNRLVYGLLRFHSLGSIVKEPLFTREQFAATFETGLDEP